MSASTVYAHSDIAGVRRRQDLRRSNAAAPHTNRYRQAKRGSGKGGRAQARRRACADF